MPCSLKSVERVWECDLQLLREGEQIDFGDLIALIMPWERWAFASSVSQSLKSNMKIFVLKRLVTPCL